MKLTISGHQIDISDSFRAVVDTGLEELSNKFQIEPVDVSVVLSKRAHLFHTDLTSHIGRGVVMRASGEADDAYASFSKSLDALKVRLRRHKNRLTHHHKHRDSHMEIQAISQRLLDIESEQIDSDSPVVIAEAKVDLQKLSVSDALMRLDLSQENTLIFRNKMNDRVNVIYKRSDGNIAWVDPE
jgi:ribosomal subunit interface protein